MEPTQSLVLWVFLGAIILKFVVSIMGDWKAKRRDFPTTVATLLGLGYLAASLTVTGLTFLFFPDLLRRIEAMPEREEMRLLPTMAMFVSLGFIIHLAYKGLRYLRFKLPKTEPKPELESTTMPSEVKPR